MIDIMGLKNPCPNNWYCLDCGEVSCECWEYTEVIEKLNVEIERLQGSELSKQCKAKDKWINELLHEIERLETELLL